MCIICKSGRVQLAKREEKVAVTDRNRIPPTFRLSRVWYSYKNVKVSSTYVRTCDVYKRKWAIFSRESVNMWGIQVKLAKFVWIWSADHIGSLRISSWFSFPQIKDTHQTLSTALNLIYFSLLKIIFIFVVYFCLTEENKTIKDGGIAPWLFGTTCLPVTLKKQDLTIEMGRMVKCWIYCWWYAESFTHT